MELPDTVDPDHLKIAALVLIGVFVIGAFLAMRFIQKLVLKLVMVAALVGAGAFVYAQRDDLEECQRQVRRLDNVADPDRCLCEFAGFEVTVPACTSMPGRDSDG